MLDYVDIHFFQDGEKAYHTQMGDRLPFKQRDIKNPKFLVHLSKRLEKGKEVEFFIRVKTESANQVPLIIVSERQFIEEDSHELIAQGVINGGVFIMIFFNLFVFFSTRDKAYLEVVGFIGSFVFFNTALKGYAYQYFWPGFAWWANGTHNPYRELSHPTPLNREELGRIRN